MRLLRIPTFRAGVIGATFFRIGVGAVPFLLPLMLQLSFGLSPFQSGDDHICLLGGRAGHEGDRRADHQAASGSATC